MIVQDVRSNTMRCLVTRAYLSIFFASTLLVDRGRSG